MKSTNKKRKMSVVAVILGILFLLIFLMGGTLCLYKYANDIIGEKQKAQLSEDYLKDIDKTIYDKQSAPVNASDDMSEIPFQVDFDELWETNKDIVAWIYIPCIECSYPVMYSGDNDYYLHRDIYQNYLFAGSLFLDMDNNVKFADKNTIIYGHNMLNGTMFGILWHIPYQNAAADNPYFWIFTPEATFKYKIFSAFDTDPYSEAYKQFNTGSQEFLDWYNKMHSWSYIDTGDIYYQIDAKIVTLSTCGAVGFNNISTTRTLVQGSLDKTWNLKEDTYFRPAINTKKSDEVMPEDNILNEYKNMFHEKMFYLCLGVVSGIGFIITTLVLIIVYLVRRKRDMENKNDKNIN